MPLYKKSGNNLNILAKKKNISTSWWCKREKSRDAWSQWDSSSEENAQNVLSIVQVNVIAETWTKWLNRVACLRTVSL